MSHKIKRLNKFHLKQVIKDDSLSTGKVIQRELNISDRKAQSLALIKENVPLIIEVLHDLNMVQDKEIIEYSQKLVASKQKHQDTNRLERKTFRQDIRLHNWLKTQNEELINLLDRHSIRITTKCHPSNYDSCVGIYHASDQHFNELVNLPHNKYDFEIASKRERKHVLKTIEDFRNRNVTDIVYVMTGDILNSDRRDDEKTAMATNRTSAMMLGSEIIINAICELNKHFNVHVVAVDGNESRVNKDIGYNNIIASDTYDSAIYNIVRRVLRNKPGITFDENGCELEKVISIKGVNILALHGHQSFDKNDPLKTVTKLVAKYSANETPIHFVIFGHIHMAYASDLFARGGSLVGANAYSERGLNLSSRASQNSYIINSDGSIDKFVYDLQKVSEIEGYNINRELAQYNAKSADKCNPQNIYEITLDKLH